MPYRAGNAYYKEVTTRSFVSGIKVDADVLPTALANRNGTDDPAFVLTVTNLATGRYVVSGTIPVTYLPGDVVNILVSATVGGVPDQECVDSFVLEQSSVTPGSERYVATITASGNPVVGAEVFVSTDNAGVSVIASSTTGAGGQVVFFLNPGTYYMWVRASGESFNNPTIITVEDV